MAHETYKWRVRFQDETFTQYVIAKDLDEAANAAINRVSDKAGELLTVEFLTPPDSWGMVYVSDAAHQSQT